MQRPQSAILLLLYCLSFSCYAQDQLDPAMSIAHLPSRFFNRIQDKTASLDEQLTRQTEKYLQRLIRREAQLQKKLNKVDTAAAKSLFAGSAEQYAALSKKLASDTGINHLHLSGEYQPYVDSLQGMLKFLKTDALRLSTHAAQIQTSLWQLQTLQAKMHDADEIKAYVRQRRQQISQYIQQHANLTGLLGKDYRAMSQSGVYFAQQVGEYKEMLNNPDKLEKEALTLLNKLPAFQAFMKQNSQLAGLFLPGNSGTPASPGGLQTRDQVASLIQQQVSASGTGGMAALQGQIQSARSQLNGYKEKLSKLGGGSSDVDAQEFKPSNEQKKKTFWKRLEYAVNCQTTRNNIYFPTVTDFGLSAGYKLNDRSILSIGGAWKMGWGHDIQHIAISSSGVGLRSSLEIRIKGSISMMGEWAYNYTKPLNSYQQLRKWDYWTRSGLLGISKTMSMKSRVFKKTKAQLLWDVLSYQQYPRTQAVVFRIAYAF